MKPIFALAFVCFFMFAHLASAQEDTSESELQGILDAFEDDKSQSVEGMKVDLKSIQFQTGTDKLVATDKKYIDRILDYLKSLPTVLLVIEGHTDNVGKAKSNQILSEKRAAAVKNYLVEIGVAADRIKTVGFGSTLPIASNDTDEGRRQNRRVELKFSGVSNEIHTINLMDGSQVQAQFVMINRDGSIGYKETLKSPMKKLKAPEIRNIAFHNGTTFVPKDDPTVIRKTEAAARAAEDPAAKQRELEEKKRLEELLAKEKELQELQEQQRKRNILDKPKAVEGSEMSPGDTWFGRLVTSTREKLGKPVPEDPKTQLRFLIGLGQYPIVVRNDHYLTYNSSAAKEVKQQIWGLGGQLGLELANTKEFITRVAFQYAVNETISGTFWTAGFAKGTGGSQTFKVGADISLTKINTKLISHIFLKNKFITVTPNVSWDLFTNNKHGLRLTAGLAISKLKRQRIKDNSSFFPTHEDLESVDFRVDGARTYDTKLFAVVGPQVSFIYLIH